MGSSTGPQFQSTEELKHPLSDFCAHLAAASVFSSNYWTSQKYSSSVEFNEVCVENDDNTEESDVWSARLAKVKERHLQLFGFVYRGRKDGTVTKAAEDAYLTAGIEVMQRAGIIEPQLTGTYVGDAVLCSVMAQAQHDAIAALLKIQPEIREALEAAVPPIEHGRGR